MTKAKHVGINEIEDLLLHLPARYNDYRKPVPNLKSSLDTGEKVYLKLRLTAKPEVDRKSKPPMAKIRLTDGSTHASALVFGPVFLWQNLKEGEYVHVSGKVETYNGWVQVKGIELIPFREQGRIVPVYRGKEKILSAQTLAENIAIALREFSSKTIEKIVATVGASEEDIIRYAAPDFKSLRDLLRAIHRPSTISDVVKANDSLRRINAYQALLLSLGANKKELNEASSITYDVDLIKQQISNIPFTLTQDQKRAIWDITKELNSDYPMDRLLSGDVGCGKTLAYAVPAACAHLSGKNVVIMMPNLLLANQVANEIKETFPSVGVELIIGGSAKKRDEIDLSKNPIIVGTSAILWWMDALEEEYSVDFLIVDEQQKLGVKQKEKLISSHTNFLEATATAIPKTAALVKYGGRSVSYLEECPVDKEITTRITYNENKKEVFNELLQVINDGYQIAVLYPIRKKEFSYYDLNFLEDIDAESVVESIIDLGVERDSISKIAGTDKNNSVRIQFKANGPSAKRVKSWADEGNSISISDIEDPDEAEECKRNVEQAAKNWEKLYPGQVVMIHGGLNTKEKVLAIETAKDGNCKVIITSSVIEIGLTMPDLRGLLVVDADKYGASTLHQFRGRLARKGGNGSFFMSIATSEEEAEEKSKDRLNLLVKYKKGSQIAEDDMRQRGFGDLNESSAKQAGFIDGVFPGLKMTPQDIEYLMTRINQ